MEGDGKAVYLVLYLCKETEHLALYLHADRNRGEAEKQFGSAVFPVLRQPGYRYIQMEFVLYDFAYYFHLSLSTVGKDQVGQGRTFVDGSLVTAAYHFFHRCVIIGADHCFNDVFAVVLLRWFRHFKHYAGSNGIATLYVRVIETFDMHRQLGEVQGVLHLF